VENGHESWIENRVLRTILIKKPEGKRPLGRTRCRCEDNIKMDLKYGVRMTGIFSLRLGSSGLLL
jgi:hypothetical protein